MRRTTHDTTDRRDEGLARLLVPGTGGSLFRSRRTGLRRGAPLELAGDPGAGAALLRCAHRPGELAPAATSGAPGESLAPDGVVAPAYDRFVHARPAWALWPYDWRLDVRHNGARLATELRRRRGRAGPLSVVCHSQGGLVLAAAARALERRGLDIGSLVRRAVFVGVPFFGTPAAALALVTGSLAAVELPLVGAVGLRGPAWRRAARSWPSLYQMLPHWAVVGRHPADLLAAGTWHTAGLLGVPGERVELDRHIDPALLERAREWHADVHTRRRGHAPLFAPLAGIDDIIIVQADDASRPTTLRMPHFPDAREAVRVPGDGVVPDAANVALLPDELPASVRLYRLRPPVASHALLCNDPYVYRIATSAPDARRDPGGPS
jgi:hypothetical protein